MIQSQPREIHFGVFAANFGLSSAGWLAAAVGLLLNTNVLSDHYYSSVAILLVHTFTLLTISPCILAVLFQLLPVVVGGTLASRPGGWILSILWWLGAGGFLICRWQKPGWLVWFAGLLVLAISGLIVLVAFTIRRGHWNARALQVMAALGWLLIMALSGSLMAWGGQTWFLPLQLLHWHAWTGILAWFSLMIVALGSQLLPMFLLSHNLRESLAHVSALLLGLCPVALFAGRALPGSLSQFPVLIVGGLALGLFLAFLLQCFRHRMRKRLESGMTMFLLSFLFPVLAWALAVAESVGLEGKLFSPSHRWDTALVLLMLPGFVGGATMGMSLKVLPFMSWMALQTRMDSATSVPEQSSGPARSAKSRVSSRSAASTLLPRDMAPGILSKILLWTYPPSILFLAAGLLASPLLYPGLLLFLVSAILNAFHFLWTISTAIRSHV